MPLAAGRTLSHYRLAEQIGEGGMGVVWRATDTTLDRDVAIKVLPEAFSLHPERMARFEREAKILASLNHPHVASIYGLDSSDGIRFLAMEMVEGADLAAQIERGPLPVVESLEIARQIAEALEAAHEKGIIHRDLKPANVKVTNDGQVKVLDFGLAKALEGDSATASSPTLTNSPTMTEAMTAAHVILGTAAYMSPEQARGKAVDRRADIWAFGCVLYECLTGRRAFTGETVSDTLAKILERDPDFSALPAATPARVRELLQRCLTKDAKARLRDIGDARIVLEEVLATRSSSGRLIATEPATAATTSARRLAIPIAIAALIGLVAGAGLWSVLGPRRGGGERTPRALTTAMPPGITVRSAAVTHDGRSLVVTGRPSSDGSGAPQPFRIYTRPLDRYEFKAIPGTEGVLAYNLDLDGRGLMFLAPVGTGSTQRRMAHVFLEGGAPPTALIDWKDSWNNVVEMRSGDFLVADGPDAFVRIPKRGGPASAPVKIDAGRSGVVRYEFSGEALPGDRGILVNVISYDTRGWHYSVGVLDPRSGKTKVIVDDGGNGAYSPTGHLLFARGDVILASRFDLGRLETRGNPIAVWSGLSTPFPFIPGTFALRSNGTLFYLPGEVGGNRQLAYLDASGNLTPWSPERRPVDGIPDPSPDGRRVVVSMANARGIDEIWVSELARPGFRRLGTDPNADSYFPIWSPDGRQITYRRLGKDGRDGLYIQRADGGAARRMLKPEAEGSLYTAMSWTPNGSDLIVWRATPSRNDLWILPYSEGESDTSRLRPLLPSAFNQFNPRLTRDGRLLAYGSDESGKGMTYVVELHPDGTTGSPIEVPTSGGGNHLWSADGRSLFIEDDRHRLIEFSVSLTPELALSTPKERYDFQKLGVAFWSPLPDGRFFVALKSGDEAEVTRYDIVLDWTAELERKMRSAR